MRNIKLLILSFAVVLASCFNDPGNEIVFSAEPEVEFELSDSGSLASYEKEDDGNSIEDGLRINLVGPQRNTPTDVTVEVDTELTTAIEGVHYELPSLQVTIPANSSFVDLPLTLLDDLVDPEDIDVNFRISLNIVSASGIKISPNNSSLNHVFKFICPSEIPLGTWNAVSDASSTDGCPASPNLVDFASTVTITSAGVGRYQVSDFFAGVYKNWYGACYGYTIDTPAAFDELCTNISFRFTEGFGATVSGTGTWDPINEVITLEWINDFGDTGTITLTRPAVVN